MAVENSENLDPVDPGLPILGRRNWAEIDLVALRHNFGVAAERGGKVIAIVKADAYGHGAVEVSRALRGFQALSGFGVATVAEAQELREAGISEPILVLGTALAEEREALVAGGYWTSVSSLGEAAHFDQIGARLGKRALVHVVIDTGMGRMGIREDRFDIATARSFAALPNMEVVGLASHFPSADEDAAFTRAQARRFSGLVEIARAGGLAPKIIHLANSAGILGFPEEIGQTDTTRPGLMLYGVSPLPEHQSKLRPVLTLKSRISLLRDLPPGHGISYGRSLVTARPMRVATLAIGYGDGLMRHLSGQGAEVLVHGRRCPVLGRVTMDQSMADVTALGERVAEGDEAVIIGRQGDEEIKAKEVAEKSGTIPWEVFTSLTARVPRVYRGG